MACSPPIARAPSGAMPPPASRRSERLSSGCRLRLAGKPTNASRKPNGLRERPSSDGPRVSGSPQGPPAQVPGDGARNEAEGDGGRRSTPRMTAQSGPGEERWLARPVPTAGTPAGRESCTVLPWSSKHGPVTTFESNPNGRWHVRKLRIWKAGPPPARQPRASWPLRATSGEKGLERPSDLGA